MLDFYMACVSIVDSKNISVASVLLNSVLGLNKAIIHFLSTILQFLIILQIHCFQNRCMSFFSSVLSLVGENAATAF